MVMRLAGSGARQTGALMVELLVAMALVAGALLLWLFPRLRKAPGPGDLPARGGNGNCGRRNGGTGGWSVARAFGGAHDYPIIPSRPLTCHRAISCSRFKDQRYGSNGDRESKCTAAQSCASDVEMKPNLTREVRSGYMLIEALVYIGVSFLLLGIAFAAMYRCIDNSVGLRRSADDITGVLHAGERWRADVRSTVRPIQVENLPTGQVLHLPGPQTEIVYHYWRGLYSTRWLRRVDAIADQRQFLNRAARSTPDPCCWRWELELKTRTKAGRIRPLFTFMAVPARTATP